MSVATILPHEAACIARWRGRPQLEPVIWRCDAEQQRHAALYTGEPQATALMWRLDDRELRAPRWTPALAIRLANRMARDCVARALTPLLLYPPRLWRPAGEGPIAIDLMAALAPRPCAIDAALAWWLERLAAQVDLQESGMMEATR